MHTILIAEDSKLIANILTKKIHSELGFNTIVASSLKETETLLAENECALAVADLNLPDAPDGEIIDYLSARHMPVIVYTGDFSSERRQKILSKDVSDYILKNAPAAPELVVRSIGRILKNRDTKILVVDDSKLSRKLITNMLWRFRFVVLEAEDGRSALRQLDVHPDTALVITDFVMPDMDGFELISRIREKHSRDDMAVIGISSMGSGEMSVQFLKKGANDFLSKPFLDEELYNRVIMNIETLEHFREMREKNAKLTDLNQLKNKFLGIAAHDLRNPLSSIRGFSEILLSDAAGPVNEEQREFLGIINTASEEMLALVNDLLDVSVIESGKLTVLKKKGSLKKLVEERLRIVEVSATKKQMSLHRELEALSDVSFDAARIAQVIDNFLTNAVKFSPPGSRIEIRLEQAGGKAVFSVKDQGPGLSEEDKKKLFGEFQKLSAVPTGGEKSTGLGLAIAKKIIVAHEGQIWVDSVPGHGAAFVFTLPTEA